jgi:hypothetical protein
LQQHAGTDIGKIKRLDEAKRLDVVLTLTRGITNNKNMALARGTAGIRVLEELVVGS